MAAEKSRIEVEIRGQKCTIRYVRFKRAGWL